MQARIYLCIPAPLSLSHRVLVSIVLEERPGKLQLQEVGRR